jgi:hypothetical protein
VIYIGTELGVKEATEQILSSPVGNTGGLITVLADKV